MGNNWASDKQKSDHFTPSIKKILSSVFVSEAPRVIDQEEATDLMVFFVEPHAVACRVRLDLDTHFLKYYKEFTVRYSRPSGMKTEFEKFCEGFGDYFFYGWGIGGNSGGNRIVDYIVLDLNLVRQEFILYRDCPKKCHLNVKVQLNFDRSSDFLGIKIESIPASCIKACSRPFWNFDKESIVKTIEISKQEYSDYCSSIKELEQLFRDFCPNKNEYKNILHSRFGVESARFLSSCQIHDLIRELDPI